MISLDMVFSVLSIVAIDVFLGGDNAIVIALASRKLPEDKRNKAIFIGTGLAIIVRVFLTSVTLYILQIPYLLFIGGLLLIVIAYNLLVEKDNEPDVNAGTTLFSAIRTIVFADIVMGLDNILAIAGAAEGNIMLVIVGLMISIPIIIWGSKIILTLMEKFSFLVYFGAGILAYTAATMITNEDNLQSFFAESTTFSFIFQGAVVIIVLFAGWTAQNIANKK